MSRNIPFTLRPSNADEIPALFPIHRAAFSPLVEQLGGLDEDVWRNGFIADLVPAETSIVEVDGQTAGWFHVGRTSDEWFLHEVVVTPALQGRGLGTRSADLERGSHQPGSLAL